MSLRLLKILVSEDQCDRLLEILEEQQVSVHWSTQLDGNRIAVDAVIDAAGNEPLMDALQENLSGNDDFRLLFFELQATLPRLADPEKEAEEEADEESDDTEEADSHEDRGPHRGENRGSDPDDSRRRKPRRGGPHPATPGDPGDFIRKGSSSQERWWFPKRINREELYTDVAEMARSDPNYILMTALSAVVATAGLLLGDGAVIIGAMVIAPLIGPSMGVAFATTLGDIEMGWKSLLASLSGVATAFVVSLLAGLTMTVDPEGAEIFGRTRLTFEHVALALAAGAAGALALTQGKGAGLVGVMVAVALLPPLANAGLLLGDGHVTEGLGALVLVVGNVVCVNLAATATFLLMGVRPNTWWEDTVRKRAVWLAALLWGLMLAALLAIVWFTWGGEAPSL
ncbi:MAG: TIGR00341 family protein [Gemmatimonadales bacterium]|nr:MAG: TIGR00341 family protein [Gemmatimonadales bacterium]